MEFYEMLDQANKLTYETVSELDSLIDKSLSVNFDIPDYNIARDNPKVFYTSYGDLTLFFNDLNSGILKANYLLLTLKELTANIASTKSVQFSMMKEALAKLKLNINKVQEKLDVVKDYRDSLHYTLKFYQNMNYLFSHSY